MRTVLIAALSILGLSACKDEAPAPAPKPVEPAPAPAPTAPAPTPDPAPAPAVAAFPADRLAELAAGTVVAYDAKTGRLATITTSVGSEDARGVELFDARDGTSAGGHAVQLPPEGELAPAVRAQAAQITAALAGFEPVAGAAFAGKPLAAAPPGAPGAVTYDARTTTLSVAGRPDLRRELDGGGVTTPEPRAAFYLPGGPDQGGAPRIAVLVRYTGDVVVSDTVEILTLAP